jgi:hypothetical protein
VFVLVVSQRVIVSDDAHRACVVRIVRAVIHSSGVTRSARANNVIGREALTRKPLETNAHARHARKSSRQANARKVLLRGSWADP